jgi:hypothetical protein
MNIRYLLGALVFGALVFGALVGCQGTSVSTQSDPDRNETRVYTASVNTFDANRQLVAIYKFTQTSISGGSSSSKVVLDVENVTDVAFCVAYTVRFSLNQASWTHQGYLRNLDARSTVQVGIVSNSRARIDLGTILIRFDTDLLSSC